MSRIARGVTISGLFASALLVTGCDAGPSTGSDRDALGSPVELADEQPSSLLSPTDDDEVSAAEPIKLTLSRRYYDLHGEEPDTDGIDPLVKYAGECTQATGITIGKFSCSAGVSVPGQTKDADGNCLAPNVLNSVCDPGSKFQVLAQTEDATAVAHCRKDDRFRATPGRPGQNLGEDDFNDVAVIVSNKKNGATCFFQALGYQSENGLPGEVAAPADGLNAYPWKSPDETAAIGCTGCHDTGGFIRSPYLAQLKQGRHVLPSMEHGYGNDGLPPRYVGEAFREMRSWRVDAPNPKCREGEDCTPCNTCHVLAVNNFGFSGSGTAVDLAIRATAETQSQKVAHSPESPIWMRPGQVHFEQHAAEAAASFRDCALDFIEGGMQSSRDDCKVAPLAGPWQP